MFRIRHYGSLAAAVSLSTLFLACAGERAQQAAVDTTADTAADSVADTVLALLDDARHPVSEGEARRIVSLNPAMTELVVAMGAGGRLVGRTRWDTYSPQLVAVRDMGSGLRPNVETVLSARPDLVLLYASSDNELTIRRLRDAGIPTLSLKLDRIGQLERAATLIGTAVGARDRAASVVDSIQRTLDSVRTAVAGLDRPRVFWHVWDSPIITIGRGSFLHELVDIAGGRNVYGDVNAPSRTVELEDIAQRAPDVVLAGPNGARRIRSEQRWQAVRAVRNGRVLVVDTNLTARPGARLGEAAVHLARLLHPGSL